MITWLTAALVFTASSLVWGAGNGWDRIPNIDRISRMIAVLLVAPPALYAVGWLLMPAWGFSASDSCLPHTIRGMIR